MSLYIIAIPVHYTNSKKVCNILEGSKFKSKQELRSFIKSELGLPKKDMGEILIYKLSDFIVDFNDQYFEFKFCFISYVKIKS